MTVQTSTGAKRHGPRLMLAAALLTMTPVMSLASFPQADQAVEEKAKPSQSSDESKDQREERGLEDAWETFRPAGMEASFEMPKKPKLRERTFSPVADQPAIKVRLYSSVIQDGEMMFVAGWHDLHTIPRYPRQQQDVLEGAVATAVANVLGSIAEKKKISLERYPGREISYRFAAGDVLYRVVERVYLVGARQYQFRMLAKIDRFDRVAAERFFESVQLLDPDNDLPPRPRKQAGS